MIIEIKNLPNNRNIKNISFNVEFEDGEVKEINDVHINENVLNSPINISKTNNANIPITQEKPQVFLKQQKIVEEREHKDVPDEMLNIEF